MDRITFCNQLVKLREEANIGKNEMCRKMGILFLHLKRIETAENNFGISKALKYLDTLNYTILVSKNKDSYNIDSREKLASIATMIHNRTHMSITAFSKSVGLSRNMIHDMEKNESDSRIDHVLHFFNCLGFEVSIVQK